LNELNGIYFILIHFVLFLVLFILFIVYFVLPLFFFIFILVLEKQLNDLKIDTQKLNYEILLLQNQITQAGGEELKRARGNSSKLQTQVNK
jgi:hypothetical protein